MVDSNKIEIFTLSNPELGMKQIDNTYEELELLRRDRWDKISEIRKDLQNLEAEESRKNVERHEKRMDDLRRLDEEIPNEQKLVEKRITEILDIEQPDELHEVNMLLN